MLNYMEYLIIIIENRSIKTNIFGSYKISIINSHIFFPPR